MKSLKYGFFMAFLLFPALGNTAGVWGGVGESVIATISAVYPQSDGSIILRFNDNSPNHASCSNENKYFSVTSTDTSISQDAVKNIYAAALAAAATGRQVQYHFESSSPNCYIYELYIFFD